MGVVRLVIIEWVRSVGEAKLVMIIWVKPMGKARLIRLTWVRRPFKHLRICIDAGDLGLIEYTYLNYQDLNDAWVWHMWARLTLEVAMF